MELRRMESARQKRRREKEARREAKMKEEADRSKFLGGSDIPALLGIAPKSWARNSPYSLWLEKTQPPSAEDKERQEMFNKVLKRGKRLEPVVLDMLKDECPAIFVAAQNVRHKQFPHDYLRCEVDFEFQKSPRLDDHFPALADLLTGEWVNGEIKTVNPYMVHEWGESGTDQIPIHYAAQVMYGMMITGRRACLVVALFGIDDMRTYVIRRNDKLCEDLRNLAIEFWTDYVKKGEPPPPMSAQDALEKYGTDTGGIKIADNVLIAKIGSLRMLKQQAKDLDLQMESIELQVKLEMGENATLMDGNEVLATWKTQKNERVDVQRLKHEHPILAKELLKESTTRVFRVNSKEDK